MTNTTFGKVKRLLSLTPKPISFLNEKQDEQPVEITLKKKKTKEKKPLQQAFNYLSSQK